MSDLRLKPFDGNGDFVMWKLRMEGILQMEKLWKAVTGQWDNPTSDQRKTEMQELAYTQIMFRLTDDVARQVMKHKDPKVLWKTLDDLYLSKSLPNRITLLSNLFNFKMDTSISLQDNLNVFLKLTQELARCDEVIKETHLAIIILNSLPFEFNILRDIIAYAKDDITYNKIIEQVKQKNSELRIFHDKFSVLKSEVNNEVMYVSEKGNKSKNKGKSDKEEDKSKRYCTYCEKKGHTIDYCYKKKKADRERKNDDGNVNICEGNPIYARELLTVSSHACADKSWILDSGCTMHATPCKSLFSELSLVDDGLVFLGDHTCLEIKGIGTVPIKLHDGVVRYVQNVRYVPNLRMNLLSESVFDDLGCQINTFNGIREVSRNGKIVIKAFKNNGLYFVQSDPEFNATAEVNDKTLANSGTKIVPVSKLCFCRDSLQVKPVT